MQLFFNVYVFERAALIYWELYMLIKPIITIIAFFLLSKYLLHLTASRKYFRTQNKLISFIYCGQSLVST